MDPGSGSLTNDCLFSAIVSPPFVSHSVSQVLLPFAARDIIKRLTFAQPFLHGAPTAALHCRRPGPRRIPAAPRPRPRPRGAPQAATGETPGSRRAARRATASARRGASGGDMHVETNWWTKRSCRALGTMSGRALIASPSGKARSATGAQFPGYAKRAPKCGCFAQAASGRATVRGRHRKQRETAADGRLDALERRFTAPVEGSDPQEDLR